MTKRLELLKQITFGQQVAEDEANSLASYFVETNDWARIVRGEIDIVRGEKGAGKSAIYSLLLTRSGDFFDDNVLLIPAENPRGETVFRDLSGDPPTSEIEFIALWKLYSLVLMARELRDYGLRGDDIDIVYRQLEDAQLMERDFSLAGILRSVQYYARRIIRAEAIETGLEIDPVTQMPSGIIGRIVLKEPIGAAKAASLITVNRLYYLLDSALKRYNLRVWVLFEARRCFKWVARPVRRLR
jgi:hypothetical protein